MYNIYVQWIVSIRESHTFFALCPVALIFEGSVNPAHPKHIGSIDPSCDVVEVVKGNEWSSSAPVLLSIYAHTHARTHAHRLEVLSISHHSVCMDSWLFDLSFFVSLSRCLWDFKDAVWAVLPNLSWYGDHRSQLYVLQNNLNVSI